MLLGILLIPLLGAFVCWFLGPQLKRSAGWIGSAAIAIPLVLTLLSWGAGTQVQPEHVALFSWIPGYDFGLQLDPLSLIWTLIITGVGCVIHIYSIGYMDGDRGFARFFGFMNLFVFAMLLLVLSDNFVGLLIGWGLVGLASYFLIGFWFDRPAAVAAARKSFVINVIGDIAIHAKLGDNYWHDVLEVILGHFRQDHFCEGVCAGVELLGEKLREHFPYQRDDMNELSDDVSFGK